MSNENSANGTAFGDEDATKNFPREIGIGIGVGIACLLVFIVLLVFFCKRHQDDQGVRGLDRGGRQKESSGAFVKDNDFSYMMIEETLKPNKNAAQKQKVDRRTLSINITGNPVSSYEGSHDLKDINSATHTSIDSTVKRPHVIPFKVENKVENEDNLNDNKAGKSFDIEGEINFIDDPEEADAVSIHDQVRNPRIELVETSPLSELNTSAIFDNDSISPSKRISSNSGDNFNCKQIHKNMSKYFIDNGLDRCADEIIADRSSSDFASFATENRKSSSAENISGAAYVPSPPKVQLEPEKLLNLPMTEKINASDVSERSRPTATSPTPSSHSLPKAGKYELRSTSAANTPGKFTDANILYKPELRSGNSLESGSFPLIPLFDSPIDNSSARILSTHKSSDSSPNRCLSLPKKLCDNSPTAVTGVQSYNPPRDRSGNSSSSSERISCDLDQLPIPTEEASPMTPFDEEIMVTKL